MMDYLILTAGVGGTILAVFCLIFLLIFLSIPLGGTVTKEEKKLRAFRQWVLFGLSVGLVIGATGGLWSYQHLHTSNPVVLEFFVAWYAVGCMSRFLLLVKRHEVLSPIFGVEWGSVFAVFFWGVCGPFVTVHLIRALFIERNFWER